MCLVTWPTNASEAGGDRVLKQTFPGARSKPYETTFARIFLFLETMGLLDWRALYAVQYNIIQYDTAQHNSTQNNTIQCTIQYAFLGI